jgi:hypothetical protein
MLENTFERFIQKKHPELIEQLKLASLEQEKRQKRLEEAMFKFTNAFKTDCEAILDRMIENKLKKYELKKQD